MLCLSIRSWPKVSFLTYNCLFSFLLDQAFLASQEPCLMTGTHKAWEVFVERKNLPLPLVISQHWLKAFPLMFFFSRQIEAQTFLKIRTLVNTWQWKTVSGRKLGFLILLLVIYCTGFSASKKKSAKRRNVCLNSDFPQTAKSSSPKKKIHSSNFKENILLTQDNPNWCKIFIPS